MNIYIHTHTYNKYRFSIKEYLHHIFWESSDGKTYKEVYISKTAHQSLPCADFI